MLVIDEKCNTGILKFSLLFTHLASIYVSEYSTIIRNGVVQRISANKGKKISADYVMAMKPK